MAKVLPFKAIRPNKDVVDQVAALPYDVYSSEEARVFVKDKPLSFLNIDRPETQFPLGHDMYSPDVYDKANEMLRDEMTKGIFVKDSKPYYYIYELTMDRRVQTGIAALSSIDDYLNNVCKKHENTVAEKEVDRINHVGVTSMQTGPIFLAYRSQPIINAIVEKNKSHDSIYDFTSEDEIRHRVWIIDEADTKALEEAFKKVECTYIADGHHRTASAVKVGLERRKAHPNYTGNEEFNYFLSVLFPDNQLKIIDYNRFVKDLNGMTKEEFLDKLKTVFTVKKSRKSHPSHKYQIKMYLDHEWYRLEMDEEVLDRREKNPVKILDVSYLQDEVLTPILDIKDPRTDKRISFVGGIRGLEELERLVDHKEGSVAFAMYPTSIDELINVADANMLMPPKSTWFEPKLRSGIFIHEIER